MSRSDDLPPVNQLTGMDGLFGKTSLVMLIIFSICCTPIPVILGALGLALCKDPRARQNALIVTIIGGILAAILVFRIATGGLNLPAQ